ncbi:class I SAM-dependent methyltransferase [Arthrobacter sp. GCM10027362]|uniref:class I SAM-dependent methyltransferase n=1 Tax=Arthrobacter sp. GCM10027362 TaxID=3273379 RepID=UPI00363DC206
MGVGSALFAATYDAAARHAEATVLGPRRAALLSGLTGSVLDVGAGTGANLPYFPAACSVTAVEPDPHMRRRLEAKLGTAAARVSVSADSAEALPAADGSADAVVFTLVLCTVPDQTAALAEARRVLGPGGRLLFLEHIRGSGRHAKLQDLVRPLWSCAAQGCQPNRDTLAAISAAGFTVRVDEEFSIGPGWNPANPLVMGSAVPDRR